MVLTETTVVIWAEESRTSSCDRHSSDDGASAKTRKPSLRYMPAPSQTSFNLRSNNNGECKHNQYHEAAHCGAIKTPTVFKAYSEQKLQVTWLALHLFQKPQSMGHKRVDYDHAAQNP